MADVLELLFTNFVFCIHRSVCHSFNIVERLSWKRKGYVHLYDLMNHLKRMMLGYENDKAHGLVEEMEVIAREIAFHELGDGPRVNRILEITEELCIIRYGSVIDGEKNVVGFNDEVETLLDQLTQTSIKQLQVISIAGMAGLGKTTLARKLYKDPLIEYHFDIRAWTCVSQKYMKKDLLLGILSSFIYDLSEELYIMSNEQLGEKLYKLLKGRKYLVVLDDMWDCMAWNDIKIYLPDDKVGSRVLCTSRETDISLNIGAARPTHVLRLRNTEESWSIFRRNIFRIGVCFLQLRTVGREIAEKCEGLPLAIIIAAGLVKSQLSVSWWSQIAGSLRSYMVRDPSQYMDTLALSYNHMPPHLRSCFLFLGVFPEDYNIPVKKLIWLWIAQGFIHETGGRVLENIAQDMLMDLIKRGLLMSSKKRADGQIKACRIHDLLRDLCLRKAVEEKFCPETYRYSPVPVCSVTISNMMSGMLLVHAPPSCTLSGLCYPFELGSVLQVDGSLLSEPYESLRVLDMESVLISLFPSRVIHELGNLRYLAIQARDGSPQASISKLVNLQMLIILSRKNIVVPNTIWDMVNLRHLYLKAGENLVQEKNGCDSVLGSLQTLSQVSPQSCSNIDSKTPNLRKLGFCGPLKSRLGDLEFPNIHSLEHLQKLKLLNTSPYPEPTKACNPLLFPERLQKLTISNTGLDWEEMWTFAWLPNLEVLKLRVDACIGDKWETSDETVFRRLKVLKMHDLDLRQWISSSRNFPKLQRLVVHRCIHLGSIPSGLGKILTLDMIDVHGCSASAESSAIKIQKEEEGEGNYYLKVHITNNVSGIQLKEVTDYPTEFQWRKCRKRKHSQDKYD